MKMNFPPRFSSNYINLLILSAYSKPVKRAVSKNNHTGKNPRAMRNPSVGNMIIIIKRPLAFNRLRGNAIETSTRRLTRISEAKRGMLRWSLNCWGM